MKNTMSNELNALRDALENQNIDQIKFLLEKYHINITKIEPKQDCKDRLGTEYKFECSNRYTIQAIIDNKLVTDQTTTIEILNYLFYKGVKIDYKKFIHQLFTKVKSYIVNRTIINTTKMFISQKTLKGFIKFAQIDGMVSTGHYEEDEVKTEFYDLYRNYRELFRDVKPTSYLKDIYRGYVSKMMVEDFFHENIDNPNINDLLPKLERFFVLDSKESITFEVDCIENFLLFIDMYWTAYNGQIWKYKKLITDVIAKYIEF